MQTPTCGHFLEVQSRCDLGMGLGGPCMRLLKRANCPAGTPCTYWLAMMVATFVEDQQGNLHATRGVDGGGAHTQVIFNTYKLYNT